MLLAGDISLMKRLFLQKCTLCVLDPRMLGCGHTACPSCVRVDAKQTVIGCPHCGEFQDMPDNGVTGLPINVLYLKAARDEAKEAADFPHCIMCRSPATLTCCCTKVNLCSEHAALHATVCGQGMSPFAAEQAAIAAIGMCPADPGVSPACARC